MRKKSNFIKINIFTFLLISANPLQAMDFTEKEEEIFIESKDKYPKKTFDTQKFLSEIDGIDNLAQKPTVALDLSNDASLNFIDVETILSYLNRRNIKVNFLNLSHTDVDENIFSDYDSLIANKDFKYLDISGTPAAESAEDFSKKSKIIFIKKGLFDKLKKELEETFGKEVIERHQVYYDKNQL